MIFICFTCIRLDWMEPVDEETVEGYILCAATREAQKRHIKDDPETDTKKKKI